MYEDIKEAQEEEHANQELALNQAIILARADPDLVKIENLLVHWKGVYAPSDYIVKWRHDRCTAVPAAQVLLTCFTPLHNRLGGCTSWRANMVLEYFEMAANTFRSALDEHLYTVLVHIVCDYAVSTRLDIIQVQLTH